VRFIGAMCWRQWRSSASDGRGSGTTRGGVGEVEARAAGALDHGRERAQLAEDGLLVGASRLRLGWGLRGGLWLVSVHGSPGRGFVPE
jgi:hypothetical protein